jgi:hypothetical protein
MIRMNILRAILIGLASLVFIIAVTGYAYLFTLQTTVMDRTVVKGWLSESKLYDGRLISALVQATNAGGGQNGVPQPPADALSASPDAIKTALNATFTPDFTQTHIEGVVNNAYDWIDGASPEFAFSIPIDQKRDTLIAQLAKAVEPQIAALPICQARQVSTCRPSDMSVEQLAVQLTTDSINESGAFTEPITNKSFAGANNTNSQQPEQTTLTQLPAIREGIDTLLIVLPIAATLSLAVIIVATARGQRLTRVARLSRRVFFGMLFIFLPTAIVVWLAKDNDFGMSRMFAAQTGELVVPLIKTIGVGILSQLALITGIIGAMGAVSWIVLGSINRSKVHSAPIARPATVLVEQAPASVVQSPQPITQPVVTQPHQTFTDAPRAQEQPSANPEQPPTNYQR